MLAKATLEIKLVIVHFKSSYAPLIMEEKWSHTK